MSRKCNCQGRLQRGEVAVFGACKQTGDAHTKLVNLPLHLTTIDVACQVLRGVSGCPELSLGGEGLGSASVR